ncbi:hypothetical protein [Tomitella gaofuii]|uniref:hypothetical protein n=1 Tax=Tomitella gaofuii TaxID=2760083 RepID=UPI0015FCEAE7|nr:hypothetical protein [Tomitella gaofuii]
MVNEPARDDRQPTRTAAAPDESGLDVFADGNELLVSGDAEAVDSYIAKLTRLTGEAVQVSGLNTQSIADGAAIAASVGAVAASRTAGLVQLSPESLRLLQSGNLVPGDNGFYRMMVRGGQGAFTGQLQWQNVALQSAQLASMQTAMIGIALRTAIQGVERAVEQVQDTADAILRITQAHLTGSVVGHHSALQRMRTFVDQTDTTSDADWSSIASVGPQLEVTTTTLRAHALKVLKTLDPSLPVQARAERLATVLANGELRDTLRLLVVAEDAVYLWQSLRVDRVRHTEPAHLPGTIDDARAALADHAAKDVELLEAAHSVIDGYAQIKPLEYLRKFSGKRLTSDVDELRAIFDEFAEARRAQPGQWARHDKPTLSVAAKEAGHQITLTRRWAALEARKAGNGILDIGAAGIGTVGKRLQRVAETRESKPAQSQPESVDTE